MKTVFLAIAILFLTSLLSSYTFQNEKATYSLTIEVPRTQLKLFSSSLIQPMSVIN